jgi:hypothetical protein
MDFTLATLEDGLGNLSPTDEQIKNYIETLPKDRTLNILNKLPKSVQPKLKAALHEIWMASTRIDAYKLDSVVFYKPNQQY